MTILKKMMNIAAVKKSKIQNFGIVANSQVTCVGFEIANDSVS